MRITGMIGGVALSLLSSGCADKPASSKADLGWMDQSAMVVVGNAPATGLNAPATGLNAPATGLNAPATGLNAPGMGLNAPATGLNGMHAFGDKARALVQDNIPYYVVANELTTILQPRAIPATDFAGTNCAGKGFTRADGWGNGIRGWRFSRTYRDPFGSITSSDIDVLRPAGSWTKLPVQAGALVFPAKLTSLGASTAPLDTIVRITNKRASAYQCSPGYRAVTFDLHVSIVRDGQCFDWIDLGPTTFIPAVNSLVPRYLDNSHAGLVPKGNGWAMPVSADEDSALFKALHYSRAILAFDDASDDDATAWRYRYPTTAAGCDPAAFPTGASSCIDGASLVAAYGLVLTNLIPFVIPHEDPSLNVVAGHPGTVTGMPVFVSVMKQGRLVRSTRFETSEIDSVAVHLAPGEAELSAESPFPYDAAFGPKLSGRTCLGSVRLGLGANELRVQSMREDATGQFAEPFRSDALAVYDSICTDSPAPSTISELSFAGEFVASALPVTESEACPPAINKPWVDNPDAHFFFFPMSAGPET